MAVIEIEGLVKNYKRFRKPPTTAVAGLDLEVPEGGVYGFLGPNGAGKTTTVRCLLALIRPSGGSCKLLGADPQRGELHRVIERVGSIVETPALFPGFTGRRNLELLARPHRIGRDGVTRALERVGLTDRAGDRVKNYSLGMKQRLGIAAALLKDPEVLILDEPANGLDPAGIREIRQLLKSLGAEGRTVFISSHILSEVQQTCDHVAILARGKLITSGPVQDVLSAGTSARLVIVVDQPQQAQELLAAAQITTTIDEGYVIADLGPEHAAVVTKTLADGGVYLSGLWPKTDDLESVFLRLTQDPEVAP
ncbi:MAG TPA: ATP-binding cassette domain-containing protein [Actinomycetota bacterium]|nr:ATP-binding cassette domain-containing protein [Actinomycetota bacterium]